MNNPPESTSEITDIIWDADNTLWDWVLYAVHAYEAMSKCISDETGIPETKVAAAMKRFYTDVGTIENPFLIQGLYSMGFFKEVEDFNLDELIEKAQQTFSDVRSEYLELYPGIEQILEKTHEMGIKNHIVTDAPGFQASMRLQRFGLGRLITSVNTMPSPEPKTLPKKFRERQRKGKYKVPFTVRTVDKEKPQTNLEKIVKYTRNQFQKRVRIIGDNLQKDGKLAINNNCGCYLAEYGIAKTDLLKRILRFAPAKAARKNVATEKSLDLNNLPPNITPIDSPAQLAEELGLNL